MSTLISFAHRRARSIPCKANTKVLNIKHILTSILYLLNPNNSKHPTQKLNPHHSHPTPNHNNNLLVLSKFSLFQIFNSVTLPLPPVMMHRQ